MNHHVAVMVGMLPATLLVLNWWVEPDDEGSSWLERNVGHIHFWLLCGGTIFGCAWHCVEVENWLSFASVVLMYSPFYLMRDPFLRARDYSRRGLQCNEERIQDVMMAVQIVAGVATTQFFLLTDLVACTGVGQTTIPQQCEGLLMGTVGLLVLSANAAFIDFILFRTQLVEVADLIQEGVDTSLVVVVSILVLLTLWCLAIFAVGRSHNAGGWFHREGEKPGDERRLKLWLQAAHMMISLLYVTSACYLRAAVDRLIPIGLDPAEEEPTLDASSTPAADSRPVIAMGT